MVDCESVADAASPGAMAVPVGSGEVGEGILMVGVVTTPAPDGVGPDIDAGLVDLGKEAAVAGVVAGTPEPEYPRFVAPTGVPTAAVAAEASAIIPVDDDGLRTGVLTVQLDRWVPQRPHRAVT